MKVYQVEVGVLLNETDEEYSNYNIVYDKKYGYYNENVWFCKTFESAKDSALIYVNKGVEKTYAIISEIESFDETEHDIECGVIVDNIERNDISCEFVSFSQDYVVKSFKKESGKIVEDFIEKEENNYLKWKDLRNAVSNYILIDYNTKEEIKEKITLNKDESISDYCVVNVSSKLNYRTFNNSVNDLRVESVVVIELLKN